MTGITENERKLNEALAKLHEAYLRMAARQQNTITAEIDATRLQVSDLIAEYAKKDDTISRARLNTLLRDLDAIEAEIRRVTDSALLNIMDESAGRAYEDAFSAFQRALGLSIEYVATARVAESVILAGLNGRKPSARNIATYLAERIGPDGLTLSDRVWQFAGDQRTEIGNVLRRGIIRGDTTARMVRDIKTVYDTENWKARRLALTESNTAYRTVMGYIAEKSEFVRSLKLIPGIHRSEKCVAVSHENPHGLGVGIFLPSDTRIYQIHPNCTAYTQFVLTEEVR